MVKIGIIGGTGLDNPEFVSNRVELPAPYETPFGKSSDLMVSGVLNGVDVVMMARHGKGHSAPPSCVNYRANIFTLGNTLQCDAIVATYAVGSLRGDLHQVGDLAICDQFLDFTARGGGQRGPQTFFDGVPGHMKGVVHAPMAKPCSQPLRAALLGAAKAENVPAHDGATYVVIEGPRFSSSAESNMFRMVGGHVIGMTMVPEICLANELGVPFAAVAVITDLDSGVEEEEKSVSHELVSGNMKKFSKRMTVTIARAVADIAKLDLAGLKKPPGVF